MSDKNLTNYDKQFYEEHLTWEKDYELLAKWVFSKFGKVTYGDVGCGNGYLLKYLQRFGANVWGVDGSYAFDKFVDKELTGKVSRVDLTEGRTLQKADVAMSFEVGEHIKEEAITNFFKSIISSQPDQIVFSAAQESQLGTNHITLKPVNYWQNHLLEYGYAIDWDKTMEFRNYALCNFKNTTWFIENVFIYKRVSKTDIWLVNKSNLQLILRLNRPNGGCYLCLSEFPQLEAALTGNDVLISPEKIMGNISSDLQQRLNRMLVNSAFFADERTRELINYLYKDIAYFPDLKALADNAAADNVKYTSELKIKEEKLIDLWEKYKFVVAENDKNKAAIKLLLKNPLNKMMLMLSKNKSIRKIV